MTQRIIAAILVSILNIGVVHASKQGPYAGAGVGVSALNTPSSSPFNNPSASIVTSKYRGGLGGRVFAGYNFNDYFGIEGGYSSYANSLYKGTFNNSDASQKYAMKSVDAVGKAYLPLGSSEFTIYALGGAAAVDSKVDYQNNGVPVSNPGSHSTKKIRPKFGMGVSYHVTPHFTTSLEYSRVQGVGNVNTNNRAIPSADMVTVNFTYNFD